MRQHVPPATFAVGSAGRGEEQLIGGVDRGR
ncbi:hypothetical protein HD596_009831 [Nonomuraea jabiensis]|uniref:Uncharacterized protein n=1 Tax=Nonomuraea jabiensis TaxID=882448 RepID=A0A7W9GFX3_9ACTN|nr:hypothetical protein [Nonomuraea jabiensis]